MRKNNLDYDDIQDQHLDMLIRLAYRQMDSLEVQKSISDYDQMSDKLPDAEFQTAYALFLGKLNRQRSRERRKARACRIRRAANRAVKVAACFIVALGIATPFAIANVEAIRVKVLELLVDINEDHASISFVEDEDKAFYVPAEWKGLYYPAYIPNGYQLVKLSKFTCAAKYRLDDSNNFWFGEYDEDASASVDSEDAVITETIINGVKALVIEEDGHIFVIWAYEDRYFILEGYLSKEYAVKIAQSVRRINMKN